MKLSIGDKIVNLDASQPSTYEVQTVQNFDKLTNLIGCYCEGRQMEFRNYAYYKEELAKGIPSTKIAKKLYENKIVLEKEGMIFVRLVNI